MTTISLQEQLNHGVNKGSVFKVRRKSPDECLLFLDDSGTVDICRFDKVKYPIFEKQLELMNSFIWKPTEIQLNKDKTDFNTLLEPHEQFIFTSNLKRQVTIDSIAGRGLSEALLPLVSDSTVEACILCISYFENNIHARAYQHIIRNVYNNPSEQFDGIKDIEEIVRMGDSISKYYNDLIEYTQRYQLGLTTDRKTLKIKLYLFLHALNAMEGLRFYVSFACSFAFGETKRMIGNASEIRLIANDEAVHVAFSTALIRKLPEDDPDYIGIAELTKLECLQIYLDVVQEEKRWIKYLFQHGSMLGLNEIMLEGYLDEVLFKRLRAVKLDTVGLSQSSVRHLPWMNNWLNEENSQPAPQETEITSYVKGATVDVSEQTFADFEF